MFSSKPTSNISLAFYCWQHLKWIFLTLYGQYIWSHHQSIYGFRFIWDTCPTVPTPLAFYCWPHLKWIFLTLYGQYVWSHHQSMYGFSSNLVCSVNIVTILTGKGIVTLNGIFPDLICALDLETVSQFVASVFKIPLRILASSNLVFHWNNFPDLLCAVVLETISQFVASVFGLPLVKRIHSNL